MNLAVCSAVLVLSGASCVGEDPTVDTGPVTELLFPSSDDQRSDQAEAQNLTTGCMNRQGFDYSPEPFDDVGEPPSLSETRTEEYRSSFGLVDAEFIDVKGDLIQDENTSNLETLSAAERDAWVAALTKCTEEVSLAYSEKSNRIFEMVQDDLVQISNVSHPDLSEPLLLWRDCMTAAGWDFVDPNEMQDYAYSITDPGPGVDAEEIELAMADLGCSKETLWPAIDVILAQLDERVALLLDE